MDDTLPRYANHVEVRSSVYDVMFVFNVQNGDAALQPVATIVMSPQHAKAMYALLDGTLRRYEQRYGMLPDD
jgi:hypothetical protein